MTADSAGIVPEAGETAIAPTKLRLQPSETLVAGEEDPGPRMRESRRSVRPSRGRYPNGLSVSDGTTAGGFFTPARLEAFLAVAEEGGFSAAARRLHISQPALSQAMGALEEHLGVKLFVRTNSGVRTTLAGRALRAESRAVLAKHDQLRRVMTGYTVEGGGAIRLGIPLLLAPGVLRALARFTAGDRPTRVEPRHQHSMSTQLEDLRTGALDVTFMRERPLGGDFDAVLVARETLGVLLATDLAAQVAEENGVRLEALRGLQWFNWPRASSPAWYDELAAILRGHGIDVDSADNEAEVQIPSVMLAAVGSRQAFALVPRHCVLPVSDTVVWAPIAGHSVVQRTWAVWRAISRRRDIARLITTLDTPGGDE
jgi:DNA-binding transcriptional LysR family regulator